MIEFASVLWSIATIRLKDGRYASQYARELYQAKTPYIGDNSKVLQILSLLPIGELSPYTIELKTDGRPFRLTIKFDKEFPSEPSTEKRLQDYSAVILCLIDNADEVVWEYPNSDKTDKMVISRDTVDMRFNSSPEIRSFAQSEYDLQRLLQLLRLNK